MLARLGAPADLRLSGLPRLREGGGPVSFTNNIVECGGGELFRVILVTIPSPRCLAPDCCGRPNEHPQTAIATFAGVEWHPARRSRPDAAERKETALAGVLEAVR
mgnify:CR=1 FL=1